MQLATLTTSSSAKTFVENISSFYFGAFFRVPSQGPPPHLPSTAPASSASMTSANSTSTASSSSTTSSATSTSTSSSSPSSSSQSRSNRGGQGGNNDASGFQDMDLE